MKDLINWDSQTGQRLVNTAQEPAGEVTASQGVLNSVKGREISVHSNVHTHPSLSRDRLINILPIQSSDEGKGRR